jgi:hypothetical protein
MYRVSDAGDDLEIAHRMRKIGKVRFERNLFVYFSMRRYDQFGALRSIYEWFYIVFHGGDAEKYQYTKKEYGECKKHESNKPGEQLIIIYFKRNPIPGKVARCLRQEKVP